MSLEEGLIIAVTTLTGAFSWTLKAFYARLTKAESTLESMRGELERLERENGAHSATLAMYQRCPQRGDCPFAIIVTPP